MNIGILLAAGRSTRFKGDKLFADLNGKPVMYHSLKFLENSPRIHAIFIAAGKGNKKNIENLVRAEKFMKVRTILLGGKSRFESVQIIIKVVAAQFPQADHLVIHNAANPLAMEQELEACFEALNRDVVGAGPGTPVSSTLKNIRRVSGGADVIQTISRENLWEVQTPQVVRTHDFYHALEKIKIKKVEPTDDLSVLELGGFKTVLVPASAMNRKITTQEDLEVMQAWMSREKQNVLVGIGEDSHRFGPKAKANLMLGGVEVKSMPPLVAESDGDVVLHALCNAISSAIGQGSLGTYATEMQRQGIRKSSEYLAAALGHAKRQHRKISQCSISLEAARPLIDPLTAKMKKSLSKLLKIPVKNIGITATSGENLTPFGRGEAIRCQAMVVLK
ncbi:MAG: 2-C-methyl-D-erythritol 2,4-cyclodiphosphate synthase [Patescibacteria group bacterium]